MKKFAVNTILLASVIGLTACSNSDDSSATANGAVAFLHSIPDAGVIYLEGSERDYGSIAYRNVTDGVGLTAGTWDVTPKLLDLDNPSLSPTLLSDVSFEVEDETFTLLALTGTYAKPVFVPLSLSNDEEQDEENEGDVASDIFINVAQIKPGVGEVDIYFLDVAANEQLSDEGVKPVASLVENAVAQNIRLSTGEQELVVTAKGDKNDIKMRSGVKTIYDFTNQIIVLGAAPENTGEDFTAFYYNVVTPLDVWRSTDGLARVRFLNAVPTGSTDLGIMSEITVDEAGVIAPAITHGQLTEYCTLSAGTLYEFKMAEFTALGSFTSGLLDTIAVVGEGGDFEVIYITDDQQVIATEAKLSLTHLAYNSDADEIKYYNVHVLADAVVEDPRVRTPEVSVFTFGDTSRITKGSGDYKVYVTDLTNTSSIASLSLTLVDGENVQLALIQNVDGNGFDLINMTDIEPVSLPEENACNN